MAMSRIKIIALALVAMFCLGATLASSAFAEGKGEIVNKTGAAPVKKGAQGTSTNEGELETAKGSKIQCKETHLKGTITSKTAGTAAFIFTGCKNASGNCSTSGSLAQTIEVPVTLGGFGVGTKDFILNTVVLVLIKCGTVAITVIGSLLIPATPENKLSKNYTFNAVGKAGEQTPEEPTKRLEAKFETKGVFEDASLSAENLKVEFEEEVEFI